MDILVHGATVPVELHRSARRRTVGIGVRTDGSVVVRAPARLREPQIAALVERRASWIASKLGQAQEARSRFPTEHRFAEGETFWFLGEPRTLQLREEPSARVPQISLHGAALEIVLRRGSPAAVRRLLVGWYCRQAEVVLSERVALHAARIGVDPRQVEVTGWRARWGACLVAERLLRFNWRLVQAPLPVLDYVVVHELMHLQEPNHSRRFWQLVGSAFPDYSQQRDWLRRWGAPLLLSCRAAR